MTNFERDHQDANKRIQQFEIKYATQLDTIAEYAEEKEVTNVLVTQIDNAVAAQQESTGGIATNKDDLLVALADVVIKYAMRGAVKAHQLNNVILGSALSHPESYIGHANDTDAAARASDLIELMHINLGLLTNITEANILEMTAALTAFRDTVSAPVMARQTKKVEGTNVIKTAITAVVLHTDQKRKLIASYFGNEEIETAFLLASQIISTGTRHNKVDIHLVNNVTNEPIITGTISNTTGNKTATVSSDTTHMEGMKTGMNHYTATTAGYLPGAADIRIHRSITNEFTIRLTPIV